MTTFYVDNSALSAYAKCPSQAILRYHLGYTSREEAAALKAGTAAHIAMEWYLKGYPLMICLARFESAYKDWAEANVPFDDRLSYANVRTILSSWIEDHIVEQLPYIVSPDFIEVGFALPLDDTGEIVLSGRFDAAVQSHDGKDWYVLDHKTTGRLDSNWVRKFQMDSQMSGYIWALSQMVPSVAGAYINGIELKRIPSDTKRKCTTHGVVYAECGYLHYNSQLFMVQRTLEELHEWKRAALGLAREYQALCSEVKTIEDLTKAELRGMFNGSCAWCESYSFCLSGRQPYLLDSMFVYSPWAPWKGLEVVKDANTH